MQLSRLGASLKTVPLWTEQHPRPDSLPVVEELPAQVDVAVVGGGYTGLNAARVLAQNGATVAVLEQHTIGWGASSRNGGMATTGIKQSMQVIFKRYGEKLAREFWQASLDAIDLIGEIVADEGIACDFWRKGHVALAYKPSHFERMKKKASWYRAMLDYKMTLASPADLTAEIGSTAFYGGLIDEWSAGLHPAKYVFGLAQAAARYGALLLENTAVQQIKKQNGRFQLQTGRGTLQAGEVLVATNGYTGAMLPGLSPRIFPVGSYIIVTEPLSPELQRYLSPKERVFYDSKWFLNYFRLTPDGRMLFGGRNNLSTGLDLVESAQRLRAQMVRVFPELHQAAITHSWTGQLGLTFDLMPHIGRIGGVHYAMGYGGHGVSIATYVGTEAGKLLCGQITRSPFMEIDHQTYFFYRKRPWFLPLAAFWYRLLDWLT